MANKVNNKQNDIVKKLKEIFALTQMKFTDISLPSGDILRTPDDTLMENSEVTLVSADGTEGPAEGTYTLQDGSTVMVDGGKVTTITPASEPDSKEEDVAAMAEPDSKKGKIAPNDMDGDGSNMDMVIGILQNIADRLEQVEKALGEGSKSQAAMKKEFEAIKKKPGATPINKIPETASNEDKKFAFGSNNPHKAQTLEWFVFERESMNKNVKDKKKNEVKNLENIMAMRRKGLTLGDIAQVKMNAQENEVLKTEKFETAVDEKPEPRSGGFSALGDDSFFKSGGSFGFSSQKF